MKNKALDGSRARGSALAWQTLGITGLTCFGFQASDGHLLYSLDAATTVDPDSQCIELSNCALCQWKRPGQTEVITESGVG